MVILESMAYGLPIVMYDLSYLSLVKDGKGVLTAPIGDIKRMAEHVISLLGNISYRKKIGEDAKDNFNKLIQYDLEMAWRNIIRICLCDKQEIVDPNYYSVDKLNYADKFILPMFLDGIRKGYDHINANSCEFKNDCKVLKYLQIVKNKINKMKEHITNGKK